MGLHPLAGLVSGEGCFGKTNLIDGDRPDVSLSAPAASLLFLFLYSLLSPVRGWTQTQGPIPSQDPRVFEGQIVTAIELVANPHRDTEPLCSVITQKVGEPYSHDKVAASVLALEKAGKF